MELNKLEENDKITSAIFQIKKVLNFQRFFFKEPLKNDVNGVEGEGSTQN